MYLKCIDDINSHIDKNLNSVCKTNKNDQVCKDLDYYNEFIQISNIINYEKNNWLELNIINKFRNIITENNELLKELKEKVKELQYKNEYIDRYLIFKLILEFYLQKLENVTNKIEINKCIEDVETKQKNKKISGIVFDDIKKQIQNDNNGLLPLIDNNSFNILFELLYILINYCLISRGENIYCDYNKNDEVFKTISSKIITMKCDDFKYINNAIRERNLYFIYNKKDKYYEKLSRIYSALQSFMNDYVYSNDYKHDKCLTTNVDDYTDKNIKQLKLYAKPKILKF